MDFGCRWSSGNNHSLRGRVRCVVLIASYREARVRGLALKKEAFEADFEIIVEIIGDDGRRMNRKMRSRGSRGREAA